ncbi:3-phosphoglycerate dehydrogenase [bacterium]|nr:3-phosphoglycerate dehydrogenase [bacterium]
MSAKVLICDPLDPAVTATIKEKYDATEKAGMSPEELVQNVPGFDAMIVRSATKVREPAINAMDTMKVIIRGGVGLDNIDVSYARNKGINVENTPTASSPSVAELALGHIFSCLRFIQASNVTMRKGEWNKKQYKGKEIAGKVLGIIGIGRIGKELAQKAMALGAKVIAYDAYIPDSGIEGVRMVPKETLLKESDIISLHIPAGEEPEIGAAELAMMKDDAILINCARGGVVDEKALLDALNSGKFWGVGIDVWEQEPTSNLDLINHPKVSATPHLGANAKEAMARVGGEVLKILEQYFG